MPTCADSMDAEEEGEEKEIDLTVKEEQARQRRGRKRDCDPGEGC